MTEFPTSLHVFSTTLTHLTLHHNKITTLIVSLPGNVVLPNLQTLDLSHNLITAIQSSSGVTAFPAVQTLNLTSNRLTALPADLTTTLFPALTSFMAASNRISEITASSFTNLNILDLSNNDIGYLPPELGNVTSIQTLMIDGNRYFPILVTKQT
ncbi:hypothetical protein BC938DRAFT_471641 [Jimgerdemannia flammicorona]|uniref:L domain-like protein n=1 Tax=Jimgerdemannia flammicorona TaxID=994334 RepID=A0A433R004_9FUNG|nr:hypothetical protein BC938DRAFT_471641 [Jimgerdemannia flammicorona]